MFRDAMVPDDFEVPELLETSEFRLRPLTIHDVVKDYDAVMSDVEYLAQLMGGFEGGWPRGLTLTQDLVDLGWHQKEFERRSSFAYTVMALDERECLGCVYIYPAGEPSFDAEVTLWVRKSAYDEGLEPVLLRAVKRWLDEAWPFSMVLFPSRLRYLD